MSPMIAVYLGLLIAVLLGFFIGYLLYRARRRGAPLREGQEHLAEPLPKPGPHPRV